MLESLVSTIKTLLQNLEIAGIPGLSGLRLDCIRVLDVPTGRRLFANADESTGTVPNGGLNRLDNYVVSGGVVIQRPL